MKNRIKNRADLWCVVGYATLLVVGIWHGFPSLKIVADEAPFVGGVLRALEAKTLLPTIDYSYTLSFYANYFLTVPFVLGLLAFVGGSIAVATSFLMEHVYLAYLIPRLVSGVSAVALLIFFLKLMKGRGAPFLHRLTLGAIVFGNLIFFAIAHTGKMWLLSLLLWFLSFYYFDRAGRGTEEGRIIKSPLFWCPVFAFLALANFPINAVALLFVGWLWIEAWKERTSYRSLAWGSAVGLLLFFGCFIVNYNGWVIQNAITPVEVRHFSGILRYLLSGAVLLMPFHLLYGLLCSKPAFNRAVAALLVSLGAYLVLLVWRASWIGGGSLSYWRYFVYITFITGLILSYMEIKRMRVAVLLAAISLGFMVRVDYLLAIPTTYNQTINYLLSQAGDTLVVSETPYLDVPKDAWSYGVMNDALCQSRCVFGRKSTEEAGKLRVIDAETQEGAFAKAKGEASSYFLVTTAPIEGKTPLWRASNGLSHSERFGVDYDLGPYRPSLWKAERLGPEFFVYRFSR